MYGAGRGPGISLRRAHRDAFVAPALRDDLLDGRGVLLTLTEAGLAKVIETAPGHLASVRARLIDQLTPAQIKTLGQIMTTVSEGMEQ